MCVQRTVLRAGQVVGAGVESCAPEQKAGWGWTLGMLGHVQPSESCDTEDDAPNTRACTHTLPQEKELYRKTEKSPAGEAQRVNPWDVTGCTVSFTTTDLCPCDPAQTAWKGLNMAVSREKHSQTPVGWMGPMLLSGHRWP